MPEGELFWNPYRMVPIRDEIVRRRPLTDERFSGVCGRIVCTIENLSLLFVGQDRATGTQFLKCDGRCVIPGSSLKGMLRSLAEIVGGGCFVTHPGNVSGYPSVDQKYKPCSNASSLCIACRMFGMMERGRNARMHKGKVSISDALAREESVRTTPCEVLLMNQSTRHRSFYETPTTGQFDGRCRKMYFHQPGNKESVPPIPSSCKASMKEPIPVLQALQPGHHFDFDLQFTNLESAELELLVYILALEEAVGVEIGEKQLHLSGPMRHKIGHGKPIGMGSCRIGISRMEILPAPVDRFAALGSIRATVFEGEALQGEIARLTGRFAADTSPTMVHLRKMMVWDERDNRTFRYPDYYWFKNGGNANVRLKSI